MQEDKNWNEPVQAGLWGYMSGSSTSEDARPTSTPSLKPTSVPKQMQKQDHGICDGVLSDQIEPQTVPRTETPHQGFQVSPAEKLRGRVVVNPRLPESVTAGAGPGASPPSWGSSLNAQNIGENTYGIFRNNNKGMIK